MRSLEVEAVRGLELEERPLEVVVATAGKSGAILDAVLLDMI